MKRKIPNTIFCILIIAMILAYLGIFAYLNMVRYEANVDSDIAAEGLLAREIWKDKTITPDNWVGSTERRIFAMPLVASLFYGLSGSIEMGVGSACIILGLTFIVTLYFFLKHLGFSLVSRLAGIMALLVMPVNNLLNDGEMVPFTHILLFLFAEYYVLHITLFMLIVMFVIRIKKAAEIKIKDWVLAGILLVANLALSLGGNRSLQLIVLPMTIWEAISLFRESAWFKKKLPLRRYFNTLFTGGLVIGYGISTLYGGHQNLITYLNAPSEVLERLTKTIPAAILEGFGIAGGVPLSGFAGIMQLLVYAFLALIIFSAIQMGSKKLIGLNDSIYEATWIYLVSLLATIFMVVVTTTESYPNYFVMSWFLVVLIIASLVESLSHEGSGFIHVVLAAMLIFGCLNIKYTYVPACTSDNLSEYAEVADYLEENGYTYSYAQFWDAGRIAMQTDGSIIVGNIYDVSSVEAYWWLTDLRWYPDNIPAEMRTAYVIHDDSEAVFLKQFEASDYPMTLVYEAGDLNIYCSEYNWVELP